MRNARAIVAISFVLGAASFVTGCGDADSTWSAPPAVHTTPAAPVQADTAVQATGIAALRGSSGKGLWCAMGGVCYAAQPDGRELYRLAPNADQFSGEVLMPIGSAFSISLGEQTIFMQTADGIFTTSDGEGEWTKVSKAPADHGVMTIGLDGRLYVASGAIYGNAGEATPIFVSKQQAWDPDADFVDVGASCRQSVLSMAATTSHDLYVLLENREVYVMRNGNPLWEAVDTGDAAPDRIALTARGTLALFDDRVAMTCEVDPGKSVRCIPYAYDLTKRTNMTLDAAGRYYVAAADQSDRWAIYWTTLDGSAGDGTWTKLVDMPSGSGECTELVNDHVGDLLTRCGGTVYRSTP